MNVALERLTDFWRNLGRREQALASACVVVLLLVIVFFVLSGGEETTPIDASTSGSQQALPEQAAPPPPGAIVADKPGVQAAVPAPAGGGVAGLNASGGAGGEGGVISGARAIGADWEQDQEFAEAPKVIDFPPFSAAVASAGRDLERVAQEYKACVATRADIRPCVNVIKYGIFIDSDWHASGKGVTLSKLSSDGHRLDFTIMPDGTDCRALDEKPSCTAWSTG